MEKMKIIFQSQVPPLLLHQKKDLKGLPFQQEDLEA